MLVHYKVTVQNKGRNKGNYLYDYERWSPAKTKKIKVTSYIGPKSD